MPCLPRNWQTITLNIDAAVDATRSLNEGAILLPNFTVGTWYKNVLDWFIRSKQTNLRIHIRRIRSIIVWKSRENQIPGAGDMNVTYEGIVTRFMRTNVHTEKETTKKQQRFLRRIPRWTLVQNAKENVSHPKS